MVSEQIQVLPLDKLVTNPQVRQTFDPEAIAQLAATMKEVDQLQPIRVRKVGDKYVIVDGERRFRAAKVAGWTGLGAIVESKDLCEGEVLQRQLISTCQRVDVPALEKGQAIAQMVDVTGWKVGDAAARIGLSAGSASKLLRIQTLPDEVQVLVAAGKIPVSAAYQLSRLKDAERQQALATEIADGRLSRDGLVASLKRSAEPKSAEGRSAVSRVTAPLGAGRSVTVVGRALNLEGFIEILEELLGQARKARPSGVELKTFIRMLRDRTQVS